MSVQREIEKIIGTVQTKHFCLIFIAIQLGWSIQFLKAHTHTHTHTHTHNCYKKYFQQIYSDSTQLHTDSRTFNTHIPHAHPSTNDVHYHPIIKGLGRLEA